MMAVLLLVVMLAQMLTLVSSLQDASEGNGFKCFVSESGVKSQ